MGDYLGVFWQQLYGPWEGHALPLYSMVVSGKAQAG